jgi:uncharacterized RDD family membrane protein YckC
MSSPYAGVGRRAIATIIDIVPSILILVLVFSQLGETKSQVVQTETSTVTVPGFNLGGMGLLMLFLFTAFYYIGMELTFGGTIGKLFTGLRVCNADGSPLGIKGALLRFFFRWIDGLFCYLLAAVLVMATAKKQRLGDLVGGTVVVYRSVGTAPSMAAPVQGWPPA